MTGVQEYNQKYINLAKGIIDNYKEYSLLEGYYNYILPEMSYSSAYTYLNNVKNFLTCIGKTGNGDITFSDYSNYIAQQKQHTASYAITVYTSLKKFSTFLKANQICEDHMIYIKRPKYKEKMATKQKRETKFLNKSEIATYLNNINKYNQDDVWKQRDLSIVLLFLNTGIRCSALQKLDVADIDFDKKIVYVTDKGEDPREIILSEKTIAALKKWIDIRKTLSPLDSSLFVSKFNKRLTTQSIYNLIVKYGVSISNKTISPHTMRATYGTSLYNETNDLYFVQSCMGHSNPKTTEIYIRGQESSNKRKAAAVMDTLMT